MTIDHNILGAIWQTSGYGLIWIRIPAHFRLIFRPWQSMRSVSALVANVMVSANLKKSVLKGLDIVFAALGLLRLHKIESNRLPFGSATGYITSCVGHRRRTFCYVCITACGLCVGLCLYYCAQWYHFSYACHEQRLVSQETASSSAV